MKKIIASAGMVAVGTTSLLARNYGDLPPDQAGKRWSVSAAVRGFYDDNYTTRPSGPQKRDSFGIEVSPSASINLPMETSYLGASYIYTLAYFEDRDENKTDQSHDARLTFDHRFSERYRLNFWDQFVYSVEPTILDQGVTVTTPLRAEAEAIHNRAALSFDAQITPLWSARVAYENNYYNYLDGNDAGSYSALLDRVEHLFRLEPRYNLSPNTLVFGGYQYGIVDYQSDQFLSADPALQGPDGIRGTDRDSDSHYFYGGAEHRFSPELSVDGRVGVQFVDYSELNQDEVSPYIDIVGTYQYIPGSYLKLGVKQAHNATDVGVDANNELTLDQETTTVYLSVRHRLTALLSAGLLAQYQHSVYNGGSFDGESDDYLTTALTLAYKINRHFSAELSYDFYHLSSDIDGREFTRNRVLVGVRGTY